MRSSKKYSWFFKLLFSAIILCFFIDVSFSQPPSPPQRTLTVTATQPLHFGTLCITGGAGGTVTIGWDGSRSLTGDILLLAMAPVAQPAIFEVKLCQGRDVTITFDATATLTGSNGGSLTLDIGPTEKGLSGDHFPTNSDCNFITLLRVGGTLHVPGNVIPGTYTGSFNITFNQQ
jgi:hypothetical protein